MGLAAHSFPFGYATLDRFSARTGAEDKAHCAQSHPARLKRDPLRGQRNAGCRG